jgi:hypothetical protein
MDRLWLRQNVSASLFHCVPQCLSLLSKAQQVAEQLVRITIYPERTLARPWRSPRHAYLDQRKRNCGLHWE